MAAGGDRPSPLAAGLEGFFCFCPCFAAAVVLTDDADGLEGFFCLSPRLPAFVLLAGGLAGAPLELGGGGEAVVFFFVGSSRAASSARR